MYGPEPTGCKNATSNIHHCEGVEPAAYLLIGGKHIIEPTAYLIMKSRVG